MDTWPLQKILAKAIISMSPRRMTAALVLSPLWRPSQNPAPTATMFWKESGKPGHARHTPAADKGAGKVGAEVEAGTPPPAVGTLRPSVPSIGSCALTVEDERRDQPSVLPFVGPRARVWG